MPLLSRGAALLQRARRSGRNGKGIPGTLPGPRTGRCGFPPECARRSCRPAPIPAAVRAGCTFGAAGRRRSSKADGAARQHARRRGWQAAVGREMDARGSGGRDAIAIAFRWVWPCWSRAGLRRGICARLWRRRGRQGRGKLGHWLVRQRERERGAGDAGAGAAMGLPGAGHGVSRPGRADRAGAAALRRRLWRAAAARGGGQDSLSGVRGPSRSGAGAGRRADDRAAGGERAGARSRSSARRTRAC